METDQKKTIGQRLQLLRLERNLTQEQMGEKLNLSTSAYCKIEYGETDLTLMRLNRIAEILEMSAVELFIKINGNVELNCRPNDIDHLLYGENSKSGNGNELRSLVEANSKLIDMLEKRIARLEQQLV